MDQQGGSACAVCSKAVSPRPPELTARVDVLMLRSQAFILTLSVVFYFRLELREMRSHKYGVTLTGPKSGVATVGNHTSLVDFDLMTCTPCFGRETYKQIGVPCSCMIAVGRALGLTTEGGSGQAWIERTVWSCYSAVAYHDAYAAQQGIVMPLLTEIAIPCGPEAVLPSRRVKSAGRPKTKRIRSAGECHSYARCAICALHVRCATVKQNLPHVL